MPHDPEGGEFVWINAEMFGDRRIRQLSPAQFSSLTVLYTRAAEEGRSGWIPIEAGETAAETLVRITPPFREGPPSLATAQATLDHLEQLGPIAVEPARIRMAAPELFSYEQGPDEVNLLDFKRSEKERDAGGDA